MIVQLSLEEWKLIPLFFLTFGSLVSFKWCINNINLRNVSQLSACKYYKTWKVCQISVTKVSEKVSKTGVFCVFWRQLYRFNFVVYLKNKPDTLRFLISVIYWYSIVIVSLLQKKILTFLWRFSVARGRFELPTSGLWILRSNQLSYLADGHKLH